MARFFELSDEDCAVIYNGLSEYRKASLKLKAFSVYYSPEMNEKYNKELERCESLIHSFRNPEQKDEADG